MDDHIIAHRARTLEQNDTAPHIWLTEMCAKRSILGLCTYERECSLDASIVLLFMHFALGPSRIIKIGDFAPEALTACVYRLKTVESIAGDLRHSGNRKPYRHWLLDNAPFCVKSIKDAVSHILKPLCVGRIMFRYRDDPWYSLKNVFFLIEGLEL